ncbi:hypothetical protein [Acetobacter persici]|uniref:hypothetical protein n=1 Tax=Acetobacter persici TaxID=1076596 RepID=UPI001F1FC2C9|nr:hypothetical protein [Acetobacter persici]MCG0998156.1 hypothetical protein [Acetobacter persici]
MSRLRKAWKTSVKGYEGENIVYAETAGKARYQVYLDVSDCNDAVKFADIKVLRNKTADVVLPDLPGAAKNVTQHALEKLLHACGATRGNPYKCGYRGHFYCNAQNAHMAELVDAGLMHRSEKGWGEGMVYFHATDIGQKTALAMIPLYRGEDFIWPRREILPGDEA